MKDMEHIETDMIQLQQLLSTKVAVEDLQEMAIAEHTTEQ